MQFHCHTWKALTILYLLSLNLAIRLPHIHYPFLFYHFTLYEICFALLSYFTLHLTTASLLLFNQCKSKIQVFIVFFHYQDTRSWDMIKGTQSHINQHK